MTPIPLLARVLRATPVRQIQRVLSATRSTSSTTFLRVSRLSTRLSELSRKERRMGTKSLGPSVSKAASSRRKPRSADCICANPCAERLRHESLLDSRLSLPSSIARDTSRHLAGSCHRLDLADEGVCIFGAYICPCGASFGVDDVLSFLAWPQSLPPSLRSRPAEQSGECSWAACGRPDRPRPSEVIQIPPESKTGTALLKDCASAAVGSVIIVGHSSPVAECEPKPKMVSSQ